MVSHQWCHEEKASRCLRLQLPEVLIEPRCYMGDLLVLEMEDLETMFWHVGRITYLPNTPLHKIKTHKTHQQMS
jgi:hypothetical protein